MSPSPSDPDSSRARRAADDDRDADLWPMLRALELARRGEGRVEPNPMVGCVLVRDGEVVGEGWHQRFGGAHAEVEAIRSAGTRARGATAYVTLEPCSHQGKTPPCSEALIAAAVRRVVCALQDPFQQVAGRGAKALREAGIEVELGLLETEARRLNAPYLKRIVTGRPWTIAKWAMTLDGRIATADGQSKWISGPQSRARVHALRGRMDAIIVGRGTAVADDPLLTARPAGPRVATRVVLDSCCALPTTNQLVRTAREIPVLVACTSVSAADRSRLERAGVEVLQIAAAAPQRAQSSGRPDVDVVALLDELARRQMTNVLVEGGSEVLGSFLDAREIDEFHVFIAPKIIGGAGALAPVRGRGIGELTEALALADPQIERVGDDLYVHGRVQHSSGDRSLDPPAPLPEKEGGNRQ